MQKKEEFTEKQAEEAFDETLKNLDKRRVDDLKNLLALRQSKTTLLKRETERLKSKYGERHPRTLETIRKIALNEAYLREIEKQVVYAETPTPAPERNRWVVYGYVLDDKNNFVDGAVVKFFDQNHNEVGSVTDTTSRGFFTLETRNISSLPIPVRVGVSPTQLSAQELTPALGRVNYAEIILSKKRPIIIPNKPLPLPSALDFAGWIVTGKVVDARGNPVADLTVEVYDKDAAGDDLLRQATTDEEGVYRTTFSLEQFNDLGLEEYPELSLIIKDAAGETLFDGKQEARSSAGRIELTDVKLEKPSTKAKKSKVKNDNSRK